MQTIQVKDQTDGQYRSFCSLRRRWRQRRHWDAWVATAAAAVAAATVVLVGGGGGRAQRAAHECIVICKLIYHKLTQLSVALRTVRYSIPVALSYQPISIRCSGVRRSNTSACPSIGHRPTRDLKRPTDAIYR